MNDCVYSFSDYFSRTLRLEHKKIRGLLRETIRKSEWLRIGKSKHVNCVESNPNFPMIFSHEIFIVLSSTKRVRPLFVFAFLKYVFSEYSYQAVSQHLFVTTQIPVDKID